MGRGALGNADVLKLSATRTDSQQVKTAGPGTMNYPISPSESTGIEDGCAGGVGCVTPTGRTGSKIGRRSFQVPD